MASLLCPLVFLFVEKRSPLRHLFFTANRCSNVPCSSFCKSTKRRMLLTLGEDFTAVNKFPHFMFLKRAQKIEKAVPLFLFSADILSRNTLKCVNIWNSSLTSETPKIFDSRNFSAFPLSQPKSQLSGNVSRKQNMVAFQTLYEGSAA
jgi:hypothetical protein